MIFKYYVQDNILTFVLLFQMLATKFHGNFLINLLGVWAVSNVFI